MRNELRADQPLVPSGLFRAPFLQRVFHPTDCSEASQLAFAHALVIALSAKATLTILHVSSAEDGSWTEFPEVRHTLERWGLLPSHSERTDVLKLGINVQKVQLTHENTVKSIKTYLETHGTDLIVLATDQERRELQWFGRSLAADIVNQSGEMALFVPKGSIGFIAVDDGSISLKNILILADRVPSPQTALHATVNLFAGLDSGPVTVTLLHVGEDPSPVVECPDVAGWCWNHVTKSGEVSEIVTQVAEEVEADLIIMSMESQNHIRDAMSGGSIEQVLRTARRPLLLIPVAAQLTTVLESHNS